MRFYDPLFVVSEAGDAPTRTDRFRIPSLGTSYTLRPGQGIRGPADEDGAVPVLLWDAFLDRYLVGAEDSVRYDVDLRTRLYADHEGAGLKDLYGDARNPLSVVRVYDLKADAVEAFDALVRGIAAGIPDPKGSAPKRSKTAQSGPRRGKKVPSRRSRKAVVVTESRACSRLLSVLARLGR